MYHGEATFNDAQLGRLLATLEDDRRLADSTLVAVTADHGEEFWEHGGRDHGHTLYEELIHVPLIMRWPRSIAAGTVISSLVQLADLSPTLLRLAGGVPGSGAGHDLSGLIAGREPSPGASSVYAEEKLDGHKLRALVTASRKLIIDAAQPQPLAFDLVHDPEELHPLPGGTPQDLLATMREVEARDRPPPESTAPHIDVPESVRQAMEALGYGEPTPPR